MKNTKKLNYEALKEIGRAFALSKNDKERDEVLKPLTSNQLNRLVALFLSLPNDIGRNHALFISTRVTVKRWEEEENRRIKKNSQKAKNMLK